jgi:hypothetical protein
VKPGAVTAANVNAIEPLGKMPGKDEKPIDSLGRIAVLSLIFQIQRIEEAVPGPKTSAVAALVGARLLIYLGRDTTQSLITLALPMAAWVLIATWVVRVRKQRRRYRSIWWSALILMIGLPFVLLYEFVLEGYLERELNLNHFTIVVANFEVPALSEELKQYDLGAATLERRPSTHRFSRLGPIGRSLAMA